MTDKAEDKKIKWVLIPGEVAFNRKLNRTDLMVWWIINALNSKKNTCYVTNEYISNLIHSNPQTISNSIKKLKVLKYIKQVGFDGRRRILVINNDFQEEYKDLIEDYNGLVSLYTEYNKSYRQDIRKLIPIINNSNKDNNKSFSKEKDNDFSKKSKNKKTSKLSPSNRSLSLRLINFWNSFSYTVNHSTKTPRTKLCKEIIRKLSELQDGLLGENNDISRNWLKKYDIPLEWINKKYTYLELKEGINRLSKYSKDGYWPKNKKNFRSLNTLLYDSYNRTSMFLNAMKTPPELLIDHEDKKWKNKYPDLTKKFISSDIWPKDKEVNEKVISKSIHNLKNYTESLINDEWDKISTYYGTLNLMADRYLDWLLEQHWIKDFNEKSLDPESGLFKKFIEDQKKQWDYRITFKRR